MGSTNDDLKKEAILLRRKGFSIGKIEATLGVARSTLSGWFKNLPLSEKEQKLLWDNQNKARVHSRAMASERHREMKRERLEVTKAKVIRDYPSALHTDPQRLEVALSMLYLGEGSKTKSGLGLGNSDPMVVRFYLQSIRMLYNIPYESLRAELHLRADQDEQKQKLFWSKEIGMPLNRFVYVIKDKRTVGKPTYPGYNGVCYIGGGGVEIQRRLLYLARVLCEGTDIGAVSSFGRAHR